MPKFWRCSIEGSSRRVSLGGKALSQRIFTPEEDAFYKARLLADYDRLIDQIEGTMARGVALSFAAFFTEMEGKLLLAALRTARDSARAI